MMKPALIASAIILVPSAMAPSAMAQQQPDHSGHEGHEMPAMPQQAPPQKPADEHAGHDMSQMDHSQMDHGEMDDGDRIVFSEGSDGALGPYDEQRESSGTSWVPDDGGRTSYMPHIMAGGWMIHGHIDGVYSSQGGPRGDDKAFVGGMLMAMNQFRFDSGDKVQLRAMVSPDPFMGKSGYPLLLAAGETADGVQPLVDRQHPHDLFMELSASWARDLSDTDSVFVYAGLPGEPAFGPPPFMHRPAAQMSPEAPITHHWLDSTHITYGVATAGYVHDRFKIEASRFRGREPDEDRYDIETGELDSTAVRLSWNPGDNWALQASWADVTSPEQLEPDVDVTKYSASVMYSWEFYGNEPWLSGHFDLTAAYGRKESTEDVGLDAWLVEASRTFLDPFVSDGGDNGEHWTIFARAEAIETDELGLVHPGPVENVAKFSLGLTRDFRLTENVTLGVGALVSHNWVSDALSPLYDGDPNGGMAFVRLEIG
ncbi:MAG TPA: hypothetical protein VGO52_10265 [Hyphomonadaceae bacterium]|jgi:hypothetical protein|nr:hypothetical protein [Hyphomonadaceae bacterium]